MGLTSFSASSGDIGRLAVDNRNGVSRLRHGLAAFGRNSHIYRLNETDPLPRPAVCGHATGKSTAKLVVPHRGMVDPYDNIILLTAASKWRRRGAARPRRRNPTPVRPTETLARSPTPFRTRRTAGRRCRANADQPTSALPNS